MPALIRIKFSKEKKLKRIDRRNDVYAGMIEKKQLEFRELTMKQARMESVFILDTAYQFKEKIPIDPPTLYRLFKGSIQRQPLILSSLQSHAVFILILAEKGHIITWFGANCDEKDAALAKEYVIDIYKHDLRHYDYIDPHSILQLHEGSEVEEILLTFLETMYCDHVEYESTVAKRQRRQSNLMNSVIRLGYFRKLKSNGQYSVVLTEEIAPMESGEMPRLNFVTVTEKTAVTVQTGSQWYLWVSADHTETEILEVKKAFVAYVVRESHALRQTVQPNLRFIRQGQERFMFKKYFKLLTDFGGKTIKLHRPQSAVPINSSSKNANNNSMINMVDSMDLLVIRMRKECQKQKEKEEKDAIKRLNSTKTAGRKLLSPSFFCDDISTTANTDAVAAAVGKVATAEQRFKLLAAAASLPSVLYGWLISINEGPNNGLFVITALKKNVFHKTIFRLSNFLVEDRWVRIKRGLYKFGEVVQPLRRVLNDNIYMFTEAIADDTEAAVTLAPSPMCPDESSQGIDTSDTGTVSKPLSTDPAKVSPSPPTSSGRDSPKKTTILSRSEDSPFPLRGGRAGSRSPPAVAVRRALHKRRSRGTHRAGSSHEDVDGDTDSSSSSEVGEGR